MTLRERDMSRMPDDIGGIGQRVLREDDPYRVIGEQLADLVGDEQFAALYEPTGRAAVSPSLLALVTIFQFLEDLPDREAARQVVVRLDWKYALHLPLGDGGFDFSCLSYFRRRLLAHEQSRLVFEAVLARVRALGFLKKHGKQRTDSLGVVGAVRELSQLELMTEAVRLALRALLVADPAWVETTVPAAFRALYLERRSDYRLTTAEREAELVRVGQDGAWLLDQLAAEDQAALRALPAVETLATIWTQRYERVDGQVRRRATTVDATELIVTPHDPGVRIGQKRGHVWWGDKVHVTETIAEPPDPDPAEPADQVRFITDVTTSPAPSGDGQALAEIRDHLIERDLLPAEQVVDSGYVSGKHLAESEAAGVDLVGPPLADTSTNGFKLADFTIDRAAPTRKSTETGWPRSQGVRRRPSSTLVQVAGQVFEAGIDRYGRHDLAGAELAGKRQRPGHVHPRRGACEDALLASQAPHDAPRFALVDGARLVVGAGDQQRRQEPDANTLDVMSARFPGRDDR